MAKSPEAMADTMRGNLKEKTGKTHAQWLKLVGKEKLEKHGQIVKWLKSDHGVTHGFANLIAHDFLNGVAAGSSTGAGKGKTKAAAPSDPVDAQYAGPKAELRPMYDKLISVVGQFGKDVEVAPKKAYVSLRRNKQFAIIQPSTKDRIDVGINLKGTESTERLETSGSFNSMVSHRVRVTDMKQIDAQLKKWLKAAYDAS